MNEINSNLINREINQWKVVAEQHKDFSDKNAELVALLNDPKWLIESNDQTKINLLSSLGSAFEPYKDDFKNGTSSHEVIEQPKESFCGVSIDKLTSTQKELMDRLSSEQIKEMSKNIDLSNPEEIKFSNTPRGNLAIESKDSGNDLNKEEANDLWKAKGNGWKLPDDVDYQKKGLEKKKLYPQDSALDAMISMMPGATDDEKVENFRLLTGMLGYYWTGAKYNGSSDGSVGRVFIYKSRGRSCSNNNNNEHVRLVRSVYV